MPHLSSASSSTSTSTLFTLVISILSISSAITPVHPSPTSSPASSSSISDHHSQSPSTNPNSKSNSPTLTLPIHKSTLNKRSKTGDELKAWANNQRSHLRNKYNLNDNSKRKKRAEGGASLISYQSDSTYYTPIAIGSDSQSFNVILDTGSADLWIPASSFKTSTSTSFNNLTTPFSVTYGSGSVSGYLATDSVTLASHSYSSQTLALATKIASGLVDETLNGIMGMGFQSLSSSNSKPFWQNLNLEQDVFAFYLSRDTSSSIDVGSGSEQGGPEGPVSSPEGGFRKRNRDHKEEQLKRQVMVDQGQQDQDDSPQSDQTATSEPQQAPESSTAVSSQGQFTLGGLNDTLYTGDINYSNVLSKSYWLISLLDISINGTSVGLDGTSKSAIDTGTTLIGGPSSVVKDFYAQIEGSSELESAEGYYQYPCTSVIDFSLTFGNKSYSIPNEDFLASYVDTSMEYCMGAVFDVGSDGSQTLQWIVGDAFLKNVYSIFSNQGGDAKVGFASLAEGLDSITQSTTSSISKNQSSDSCSIFETLHLGIPFALALGIVTMLMSF